jgi:hypothetical protein
VERSECRIIAYHGVSVGELMDGTSQLPWLFQSSAIFEGYKRNHKLQ